MVRINFSLSIRKVKTTLVTSLGIFKCWRRSCCRASRGTNNGRMFTTSMNRPASAGAHVLTICCRPGRLSGGERARDFSFPFFFFRFLLLSSSSSSQGRLQGSFTDTVEACPYFWGFSSSLLVIVCVCSVVSVVRGLVHRLRSFQTQVPARVQGFFFTPVRLGSARALSNFSRSVACSSNVLPLRGCRQSACTRTSAACNA